MVGIYRLVKEKQYPQPHDLKCGITLGCDNTSTKYCTMIPAIMHDEAMLASGKNTHPEHASFAETDAANCCAESKVFRISCTMRVSLTVAAIATDAVQALRFAFMSIHGAFEDFDANDELTGVTVGNVLELTSESTDRQTYPLYDDTKISEKFTGSATQDADAPGLTATQVIENVAFDPGLYYDAINYYTISDKLKKVQDGLRWITLTQNNPTKLIKFNIKSNVKSLNPYTLLAHMIYFPKAGTYYQIPVASEVTNISQIAVDYRCRYLEWNDNMQHQRA